MSAYSDYVLGLSGLIAYYRLDEAGTSPPDIALVDSSGGGHGGRIRNATVANASLVPVPSGGGRKFNVSAGVGGDAIVRADQGEVPPPVQGVDLSVAFWWRLDEEVVLFDTEDVLLQISLLAARDMWWFVVRNDVPNTNLGDSEQFAQQVLTWYYQADNGMTIGQVDSIDNAVSVGTAIFVVGTHEAGTTLAENKGIRLYFNGVLNHVSDAALTRITAATMPTTNNFFYMAGNFMAATPTKETLDEVAIFNRILTDAEIAAMYAVGIQAPVGRSLAMPNTVLTSVGRSAALPSLTRALVGRSVAMPSQVHEDVLPVAGPATIRSNIFGLPYTSDVARELPADWKRAAGVSCPVDCYVPKLTIYLDGKGAGGGDARLRGIIYDADDGTLVAAGKEVLVHTGQEPSWVDLPFDVPGGVHLLPGPYWVGVHVGGSSNSARVFALVGGAGGVVSADSYSDGPASTFGTSSSSQLSIFATYFLPWRPRAAGNFYVGRLPFAEAQAAFAAGSPEPVRYYAECGWHGDSVDDERGSFVLVNDAGPLMGLLGKRLRLTRRDRLRPAVVYAFCHNSIDLFEDMSVPRRLYQALGLLTEDSVRVTVEVMVA